MIIDTLVNAEKYFCVHSLFSKAFEHIRLLDLDSIEVGKYEVDGNQLFFIVSNKIALSKEESIANFECHDNHIDIQLCIKGKEQIGWKPRNSCTQQRINSKEFQDFVFYNDVPDMYFQITNNQFAIFFPDDVHAPMIGEGMIKKLLMKVKL